jgi:hypothetical protein
MEEKVETSGPYNIPVDEAIKICQEVYEQNRKKWLSLRALQCGGCISISNGDIKKMCMSSPGGCDIINKIWLEKNKDKETKK